MSASGSRADPDESSHRLDGILNINKPPGITSFAVVQAIRRITGVRRVGHGGTLDPAAEGVLPVCVGRATRVVEHLMDTPKLYRAVVRLGETTDTYDAEGPIVATGDASGVGRGEIERELRHFTGEIEQVPPMHSAIKLGGVPLYTLARQGKTVERAARKVHVYRLDLIEYEAPLLTLEIECGRGTYVRSIAHDLGRRLGCGAHLAALARLRSGPFAIDEAISLDDLREAAAGGAWQDHLYAVDRVLEHLAAAVVAEQHAEEIAQGKPVALSPADRFSGASLPLDTPCRAYSTAGDFLAILRFQGGETWHPGKVFA